MKHYFKYRNHKVSSVNFEQHQIEFLKTQRINISELCRSLVEQYLIREFGAKFLAFKNLFEKQGSEK